MNNQKSDLNHENIVEGNFLEGLNDIFKKIRSFEIKNLNEDTNGNVFFDSFYKFICDKDNGIFALLSKKIKETILSNCKNLTFWINYNTHFTQTNMPELENKPELVKVERLVNIYTPAYIDKNLNNDRSVLFYKFLIEKYIDRCNDVILSIHEILLESENYIDVIHINYLQKKIFLSVSKNIKNVPFVFENIKEELNGEFSDLFTKEYINNKKIGNYIIFLKCIFETDGLKLPSYIECDDMKEIDCLNEKINKQSKNPFRHLYTFNLSHPYSGYPIGTLMIFSDKNLRENFSRYMIQIREVVGAIKQLEHRYLGKRKLKLIKDNQKKTAIISILVDSFAHNIAAHSLQQILKWLNKRVQYSNEKIKINILNLNELDKPNTIETTIEEDNINDFTKLDKGEINISSLMWYGGEKFTQKILGNSEKQLPLSFDVFRYNFLKYINSKASFWSGVIKDSVLGGTITNWFEIIQDFCYNPYFIGTIAGTENIFRVHFRIHCDNCNNTFKEKCDISDFLTIDLNNLMNDNSEGTIKIVEEGKGFSILKGKLEQKLVFLPGGDVGRHSLFTIFENTLRNVKHCDQEVTNKKQIEFNIEIKENDEKYYDVNIWLSNKTDLNKTVTIIINKKYDNFSSNILKGKDLNKIYYKNDNGDYEEFDNSYSYKKEAGIITGIKSVNELKVEYKDKRTTSLLNENIEKSIIDDNSKPRMGGIYQDKICACELLTNDFSNVDKIYQFGEQKIQFVKYIEKNENVTNNQCCLTSSLRVWKGDNFNKENLSLDGISENGLLLEDQKKIKENLRRYKLFIATDEKQKKDIESLGVVRVVVKDNDSGYEKYYEKYYDKWLDKWLGNEKVLQIKASSTTFAGRMKDQNEWKIIPANKNEFNNQIDVVDFTHSDNRGNQLLFRTHGNIMDFFTITSDNISLKNDDMHELLAKEFIETILTSVVIVDNRVNNLLENYKKDTNANGTLWEQIKIKSFPEGNNRKESEEIIESCKNDLGKLEKFHFLILHLSYIEKLSNENIIQFIEQKLKDTNDYIFKKLIITTGRGRGDWFREIQKSKKSYLKSNVLFIPPESLTSAISYGIRIKDDFEIKYRLIKLLMN